MNPNTILFGLCVCIPFIAFALIGAWSLCCAAAMADEIEGVR